jgi:uncharacterized protein
VSTELSASEVEAVLADTRAWLERAVIGLDLCPFAKAVYVGDRIRYCVSDARDEDALLKDLAHELSVLHSTPEPMCETTLLIHPRVLTDFTDYNVFLDAADGKIDSLGLRGEIQIASFHPRYQFAGTTSDDIGNYTNRSPYPMLHLLREASVERAVAAIPDAAAIFERNIETLRRLGVDGWWQMFPRA